MWHLVYSYNLMVSFKEKEFVIERSSWQLLLYAESMQMSALVSATSGDLNWEKDYLQIKPQLEEVLHKIPELLPSEDVQKIVEEIDANLEVIKEIEKEAFNLVSRGEKDKAYKLLSGWEYTKRRMEFFSRTRDLTQLIQQRLEERTSFDTTRLAILVVVLGIGGLFLCWDTTIRIWRDQVRKKQDAEEKISLLLNNSGQGFMLADESLLIDPNYSLECENIFGRNVAGDTLPELLYPEDGYDRQHFAGSLQMLMQEDDEFLRENIVSLLPERFYVNEKYILVEYRLVSSTQIMLIITDITEKVFLEQEVRDEHKRLSFVVSALENKNELLDSIREYEQFIDMLTPEKKGGVTGEAADLDLTFRKVHTFKSVFMQFEMPYTPEELHLAEENITKILKNKDTSCSVQDEDIISREPLELALENDKKLLGETLGSSFVQDTKKISVPESRLVEMQDKVQQMLKMQEQQTELHEELGNLLKKLKGIRYVELKALLNKHSKFIQQLADRCDKQLHPLEISGDNVLVDPYEFDSFIKSLVHVFRNSLIHGIEEPEERLEKGKPENGLVQCSIESLPESIVLCIKDDGRGIDTGRLSDKLLSTEVFTRDYLESLTENELLQYIFHPGISTSAVADEYCGRGVGLDAVAVEVHNMGGTVKVYSKKDEGSVFTFYLPGQGEPDGLINLIKEAAFG
ncbi:MAG: ATP-binding protein [Thermodesulfobacteriota bacterium]